MVVEKAHAKINLFLDVLGRRPDGYHGIHTVFFGVDLCDELTMDRGELREDSASPEFRSFVVEGPYAAGTPEDERNLVWRAVREMLLTQRGQPAAFWESRYPSFDIRLVKRIPHGAGLGGGSSDAAAALRIMNAELPAPLDDDALHRIALNVGSDVPYFLRGGFAEATGRGEQLAPIPGRAFPVLIVKPAFAISTEEAYASLRPEMFGPRSDVPGLRAWLDGSSTRVPALCNAFEDALDPAHPELRKAREALTEHGAVIARLSGSGSATFGIFTSDAAMEDARRALGSDYECFACRSLVEDNADNR